MECLSPEAGETVTPAGTYSRLAAGDLTTCALDPDGYASCWGDTHLEGFLADLPKEPLHTLTLGEIHALGIDMDGALVCFGDNQYSQCELP